MAINSLDYIFIYGYLKSTDNGKNWETLNKNLNTENRSLCIDQVRYTTYTATSYDCIFNSILSALNTANVADDNGRNIPLQFNLKQNYPNPFNPSTKKKYALPKPTKVKIEVLNLLCQTIKTLINKPMPAGSQEVEFIAKNLQVVFIIIKLKLANFSK